jgi:hypothetical protein
VALGVCSPLQWRNRPRFSRGSLTLGCVQMDNGSIYFKEQATRTPRRAICQEKFLAITVLACAALPDIDRRAVTVLFANLDCQIDCVSDL